MYKATNIDTDKALEAMEACQVAAMAIKAEQSIADKMSLEENKNEQV